MSTYDGSEYLDWEGLVTHCEQLAAAHPQWARLETVGESRQGRPLLLLVIGKQDGRDVDRPGFWIDAGTHCSEWTGIMSALDTATRWLAALAADEESATGWFARNSAYIMPCISPDGFHAMCNGSPFIRSTLRPPRDGRPRIGLHPEDLDGDGHVRWMRWKHPAGPWIFDHENPIVMRPRKLDDDPREAFFVCQEGNFLQWDGVRWLEAPRQFGQDLNRNFPSAWAPFEMFGMDSGDYPLSEPESHAVVETFRRFPRIGAAVSNHTYTGCLLTQPYRDPSPLSELDIDLMESLGKQCVEGTGYRVFKTVPDFSYDPKKSIVGVWSDTMSTTFGVPGYTLELWDPFGHAGIELKKPALFFKKPDAAKVAVMLQAFASEPGAIVDWKPHQHAQLGAVELGGLEYQTTVRNPPVRLLAKECERGFMVADRMRRALPDVGANVAFEPVTEGVWRVQMVLDNTGFLPTSGLRRAEQIGTAPPICIEAQLSAGLVIVDGEPAVNLGWLDGWGALQVNEARHPLYPALSPKRGTRATTTWVVKGSGTLTLTWDAGRGGCGEIQVTLP